MLIKLLHLQVQVENLTINPNDLQTAFKQVEFKKLLIRNWSNNNEDTTLKLITDFVKEKDIEFLSYTTSNIGNSEEVICHQETKMKRYNDLVIKVSEN